MRREDPLDPTSGERRHGGRGSLGGKGQTPFRPAGGFALLAALAPVVVLGGGCGDEAEASVARGDRLLGRGETAAAIAEYRLAGRQRGEDASVLLRLAHAAALQGDAENSLRWYDRLLRRDSSYRHMAAMDLVAVAREAGRRGGPDRMVRLLEPVLGMGLELVPLDLRARTAIHHVARQDFGRALPLLLSVLEDSVPPSPELLLATARAYQELGGCREAVPLFTVYLDTDTAEDGTGASARWHLGSCLYRVALEERRRGENEAALEHLDRMTELGTPRTLLDHAHFLRGELLLEASRPEEAIEAYREVLRLNPTRTGSLPMAAEERIREIRYGSG